MKICSQCGLEKDSACFARGRATCKDCRKIYRKQYIIDNKDKVLEYKRQYNFEHKEEISKQKKEYNKQFYTKNKDTIISKKKQYRLENKEIISVKSKSYYEENKEKILQDRKQYVIKNKDEIRIKKNKYKKEKRKNDPAFKLRNNVSRRISEVLRKTGGSKNGYSTWEYLPYTPQQLRDHLQSQFEPWMTWQNHGIYDPKTWDDNDPTTWTWQIDHIIPHSTFHYTSMDDQAFLDCWALSNLRPLSAKQNLLDGINRIRHNI